MSELEQITEEIVSSLGVRRAVAEELAQKTIDTRRTVYADFLRELIAAVEDPEQRRAASGRDTLGWESARDVLVRILRNIERGVA